MPGFEIPVCVAPVGDRCGEGAVWHAAEQALYWVDINRFLIHRFDECTGAVKTWIFDEPVTAMTLTDRDDTLLAVFGSKAQFWQPATNTLGRVLFTLPTWPTMRCNDARVDPRGSLWIGSMRNNVGPDGEDLKVPFGDGVLYRIAPDGRVSEWKHGVGISNTLAWSPQHDRFYFADTVANRISVWSYDAATGDIANERSFFEGMPDGTPDGSTMDSEGHLWNTRHGGGCMARVAPDGKLDYKLELPVSRPTTCTFGGADLKTLYITTACSSQRLAGGLFAVRSEVPGLPENRFCLSGTV